MEHTSSLSTPVKALIAIVILIIVGAGAFLLFKHKPTDTVNTQNTSLSNYCVGHTYATGSSGHCVSDIQTLVNYMEHSGLTECPFDGGAELAVTGTFDSTTAAQVKSIQGWSGCYAKQEGFTSNVTETSQVDKSTWGLLCTYGYTDPSHTAATGASGAIAAGKDAGCGKLQA
jgi:hypothetical protein